MENRRQSSGTQLYKSAKSGGNICEYLWIQFARNLKIIICQLQPQVIYDLRVDSFPNNQALAKANADAVLKVGDNWMIGQNQQKLQLPLKGSALLFPFFM